MYILGISAFYHDSAACLLKDGEIVSAAQEERFTRMKLDATFPHHAILYCLREANIAANKIDNVIFYEKPFLKFERLLETYFAFAPKGFKSFSKAMPVWIKEKLFQKSVLIKQLEVTLDHDVNWRERLLFSEHHLSHAASAFYPSPFESALGIPFLLLRNIASFVGVHRCGGAGRDWRQNPIAGLHLGRTFQKATAHHRWHFGGHHSEPRLGRCLGCVHHQRGGPVHLALVVGRVLHWHGRVDAQPRQN